MKSGVLGKYYTSDSPQNDKGKAPPTGKGGERRKKNTRNGMTKTIFQNPRYENLNYVFV